MAPLQLNPIDSVVKVFDEMQIDYKDPEFKVADAIEKLKGATQLGMSTFKKQEYNLVMEIIGEHKFWDKELIINPLKKVIKEGIIKKIDIKKYQNTEPMPLPEGFEWAEIDPENEQHMNEVTEFLNDNYVEAETQDFRLA